MPRWLGSIHSKYRTPYAALIVHAVISMALVVVNFVGWWIWNKYISLPIVSSTLRSVGVNPLRLLTSETGVQETFQKLLSLAVVLQLVPFLYMFGALLKIALAHDFRQARYGKTKLIIAGSCGLVTTSLGIGLAFFPAQQITSLFSYEVWMWGGTALFIGAAAFFFFVYGRRKAILKAVA
jgi:amino acid transporter